MRGVEEPLCCHNLSELKVELRKAKERLRHKRDINPRLHKAARIRGLGVRAEIIKHRDSGKLLTGRGRDRSPPPWNPIGWLFCVIRLLVTEYAIATLLAEPGSGLGELSSGEALAWVSSGVWVVHFESFIFLALLFPYSRLPSLRCRHLTSSPHRVDTQMTARVP